MTGRQILRTALARGQADRPARGEIWPLAASGTATDILTMARSLGADFCFFDQMPGRVAAAKKMHLAAGAIVNGPWQRYISLVGWDEAMQNMGRRGKSLDEALQQAEAAAAEDLGKWVKSGVDMILLADDVAYAGGPFVSPASLEQHLLPRYARLAKQGRTAGIPVGFHSDGRIDSLLPLLWAAGFQFYSLEPEGTDPLRAWELLGEPVPLLSGLPAAWLMPGGFVPENEGEILRRWLTVGPLILASACGLYHEDAAESLRRIYSWLDGEPFSADGG